MRKIEFLLLLLIIILLAGCSRKTEEEADMKPSFYDSLYNVNSDVLYEEKIYTTNKALYGYSGNTMQGYNGWYYKIIDDTDKNLIYSDKNKRFELGLNYIKNDVVHSESGAKVVREFVSNIEGNAVIYANPKCADEGSLKAGISVLINDKVIYSSSIEKGDTTGKYMEIESVIKTGDKIDFIVESENSSISFSPVITLDHSELDSLYHLNDCGKNYGDVFPWYNEEEHKLYMWYLWSDDCNEGYNYAIDLSDNLLKMKTYSEANNYDLFNKYRHNYRYNEVFDTNRFIDLNEYPAGVRDNMLYYDKENGRYLLIAGCYKQFSYPYWVSDLNIYASDDSQALSWTKPYNKVSSYDSHLPECPSLLKIGNRWYPFVSESHYTAHQIGALKYWVGDENVDCLDMDYTSAATYYLDGEDLCAARPTEIGDKVYYWGWITSSYDSVPMSPWAGYLNLPREIIQREDGTLGSRMDPGLTKYINYGNIVSYDEMEVHNESSIVARDLKRTFTTFDVDMADANEISFVFTENGKRYMCSIVKENNKVYMRISSPDDLKHQLNSEIEILNPSTDNKYSVKIVKDGSIIEFFVNDDTALTGSTSMTDASFDSYVESDGNAVFSDIKINKLRSYSDCD